MSQEVYAAIVMGLLAVAAALAVPYITHYLESRRAKASGMVLQSGIAAKNIEVLFPDGDKALPQGEPFPLPKSAMGDELLVFTRPEESSARRELIGVFLIPKAASGIVRLELEGSSNLKKQGAAK